MLTTKIGLATFLFLCCANMAIGAIHCETPQTRKSFTITQDGIVFHNETIGIERKIASEPPVLKAQTKKEGEGFTKILTLEGQKYTIHIQNQEKFDEVEDYLSIRTAKGHEITYPLVCNSKN